MKDIQALLKKFTPFTNDEIQYYIDDNLKQKEINYKENNKLNNKNIGLSYEER